MLELRLKHARAKALHYKNLGDRHGEKMWQRYADNIWKKIKDRAPNTGA